jgi:filamentous hemagglutinin family protein
MIHKAISWRLEAFLEAIKTELFNSGILLPAMLLLSSGYAIAQVKSDGTTNTTVNSIGNNFNIINGIEKSNNLFHSFSNFSIPTGGSATFNLINTPNINTIFSRVTGGNISNIDGVIRTVNSNNPVSLFLLNPNGIMFGQNAKLDIGGSFVGTTANSIKFADGAEFSATDLTIAPVLTITVPVGLQMGGNSSVIQVQGVGHNLTTKEPYFSPYFPADLTTGLQVKPGKTLALVGGDINLIGGVLTAPGGRIELGSINATGQVVVNSNNKGFALDYTNTPNLSNIQLSQKSLLNVSGTTTSSIQVQGKGINIIDGSIIWSQNRGIQPGGDINIRASELLLSGTTADERLRSGIISETLGLGTSSNIAISTAGLIMKDGTVINSRTYTPASSGKLTVNATEFIQMRGASPKTGLNSSLGTTTLFPTQQEKPVLSAKAGDVTVSTPHLSMADGSYISSLSLGDSSGGNVHINTDTTEIMGGTLNFYYGFLATAISGIGYGRGDSGTVTLNTHTLTVKDGGFISTSNLGTGNAGDVIINASESVEVKGLIPATENQFFTSNISSTVGSQFTSIQQLSTYKALGNSGNVTIRTPLLKASDEAGVTVQNFGVGNAGTVTINADLIQLERGNIGASTASGKGGNINLNLQKLLLLRNQSKILAEATGISNTGNGGNITINSPIITALENSDIIANAIAGNGGNINITTQGIFGLDYRPQLTPNSDITASSQFGVNGTVAINNFGVDPNSGLVELPVNLVDSSKLIATGCSNNTGSSFVATGRGGIPENPNQEVRSDRTWSDIRDLSAYQKTGEITAQIPPSPETLIQATSWHRNTQGKIQLVADKSSAQVQQALTCAAIPRS